MQAASGAEAEILEHDRALTEILRKLQRSLREKKGAAFHWAQVLQDSLSRELPRQEREERLRVIYSKLYNLGRREELPECPAFTSSARSGAELRVAENVDALRITLREAAAQLTTQLRPGAFFLLTCHLKKERPPYRACENFPWVLLGAALLAAGILWECFFDINNSVVKLAHGGQIAEVALPSDGGSLSSSAGSRSAPRLPWTLVLQVGLAAAGLKAVLLTCWGPRPLRCASCASVSGASPTLPCRTRSSDSSRSYRFLWASYRSAFTSDLVH
mmetsp:Transcript_109598/g.244720  ORF Transcript_109598/g.244720 Transcript_109598/m.244720 type:complete len:274 (-) Transcript_109598:13-834(-)